VALTGHFHLFAILFTDSWWLQTFFAGCFCLTLYQPNLPKLLENLGTTLPANSTKLSNSQLATTKLSTARISPSRSSLCGHTLNHAPTCRHSGCCPCRSLHHPDSQTRTPAPTLSCTVVILPCLSLCPLHRLPAQAQAAALRNTYTLNLPAQPPIRPTRPPLRPLNRSTETCM
jgi:hypothetical protein